MHNGWIKLYRKTIDNEIFRFDPTAWHVFEYLILRVDQNTGQVRSSYQTIADYLILPKITVYDSVQRLIRAKMTNASPNGKLTTFSILNWNIYQELTERSTELPPNDLYSNTRIKNNTNTQKERIYKKEKVALSELTIKLAEKLNCEPSEGIQHYLETYKHLDLKEITYGCIEWMRANPRRFKNPALTWMNWVRRENDRQPKSGPPPLRERVQL